MRVRAIIGLRMATVLVALAGIVGLATWYVMTSRGEGSSSNSARDSQTLAANISSEETGAALRSGSGQTPIADASPSPAQAMMSPTGLTPAPREALSASSDAGRGAPPRPPLTSDPPAPWTGVNNWGLAASSDVHDDCGGDAERLLEAKMTHLELAGVDVVRFAAYQSFAIDANHARNWSALDRVFASASAHGMRLIPILGNNWSDCDYWGDYPGPTGKDAGTPVACGGAGNWYDIGYRQPYNGYATGYRQWVADVVGRYSQHPALAAWELINEPWESCIHGFFVDMIGVVRGADPTTPVSLGSGGGGEAWSKGEGYARETALADWATMHDYGYPDDPLPLTPDCPAARCLRSDLTDAGALGKPFYVGESGIWESQDCDSFHRAEQLRAKMKAAFEAGASGFIVWAYSERAPGGKCGMDFGPDSPIMSIFSEF